MLCWLPLRGWRGQAASCSSRGSGVSLLRQLSRCCCAAHGASCGRRGRAHASGPASSLRALKKMATGSNTVQKGPHRGLKRCSASSLGDSRSNSGRVFGPFLDPFSSLVRGSNLGKDIGPRTVRRGFFRAVESPPQNVFLTVFAHAPGSTVLTVGELQSGSKRAREWGALASGSSSTGLGACDL